MTVELYRPKVMEIRFRRHGVYGPLFSDSVPEVGHMGKTRIIHIV